MEENNNAAFLDNLPKLTEFTGNIAAKQEKQALAAKVVEECVLAIEKYNLRPLIEKAKQPDGFKSLGEPSKELLCAGLIKLGEALTFCRDKKLEYLEIVEPAKAYADARNHFVHHQRYLTYLDSYDEAQKQIDKLPLIPDLRDKLQILQTISSMKNSDLEKLTKPINIGKNNFLFPYTHYIVSLKAEFKKLMEITDTLSVEALNSNTALEATLENRIRNILAIMVDLTDTNLLNKNLNNLCEEQKEITKQFNEEFVAQNGIFSALFYKIKEFRNALCHLDDALQRPYTDISSMIEFALDLVKMKEFEYIEKLEEALQKPKVPAKKIEDKKEGVSTKHIMKDLSKARHGMIPSSEPQLNKKQKTEKQPKDQSESESSRVSTSPLVEYPNSDEDSHTTPGLGGKKE